MNTTASIRGKKAGRASPAKKTRTIYFSFGIGMAGAISEVAVTEKRIRRIVMFHGIIAFFFNVTLLALTMNLVRDAIQNG
jgi:uncharacterized membrane protein